MENKESLLKWKKAVFDALLENKQKQFEEARDYQRSQLKSINEADLDQSEMLENQTENMMQEMRVESESLDHLEEEINTIKANRSLDAHTEIGPSTVVKTNIGNFVVCVPMKSFKVNGEEYRGISTQTPIYNALQGKGAGEKVNFNDQDIAVKEVI